MVSKVFTATLLGLDCQIIDVEVDYRHGMSHFAIVGLGDKSVQEAKERIVSAIRSSGAEYVPKRVIVNLAPADIPKTGPAFDLAIAIGFLISSEQLIFDASKSIFLGELALDGSLRPISGVLPMVDAALKLGFTQVFLPLANAEEASLVKGIKIYAARNLVEVINHFRSSPLAEFKHSSAPLVSAKPQYDLADVKGQLHAKRALEIAAAGGHNLLLSGVPGSGKTLLAKCLPGIMPEMSYAESLEATKIHSIAGKLHKDNPLVTTRPFRSPHHTTSRVALVGGGIVPRPGEISLSHRGVLFLDEFPEFSQSAIEVLRQPLEDKQVSISRVAYAINYPANFILVAAMNPCKCGHFGDPDIACTCSALEVAKYRKKISGPILDRIDLVVNVYKIDYDNLFKSHKSETSLEVKCRVQAARNAQIDRLSSLGILTNSEISHSNIDQIINITPSARTLVEAAVSQMQLSARTYFRLLKTARTIADLALSSTVDEEHIAEALSYRVG